MSLPTDDHVERWLHKLGETDEQMAQLHAARAAQKERLKIAFHEALPAEGTVQERERAAYTSAIYREAVDKLETIEFQFKLLELKRMEWTQGIEVWRTQSANARRTS